MDLLLSTEKFDIQWTPIIENSLISITKDILLECQIFLLIVQM